MRSFMVLAIVVVLACAAAPAFAIPADVNAPDTTARSTPAQVAPPAAAPASDGGTATAVYALIAAGGFLALGGGGFLGARSVAARQVRPRAS
jgi:hypothetical protein